MGFFDKFKKNDEWKERSDVKSEMAAEEVQSDETQAETKYPVTVFENRNISANPPYVVLQFTDGYYIQLIDFLSRQFNDSTTTAGNGYSIALFRLTEEEGERAKNSDKEFFDNLASQLYNKIPADRFVRASVVENEEQHEIHVEPKCISLNGEGISELEMMERIATQMERDKEHAKPEELLNLKKEIGKKLLETDALWIAYDTDFSPRFPYVGLMGRLEIFTKQAYAEKAVEHFKNVSEGHIIIRKLEKKDYQTFFDEVMHAGLIMFNLDNGFFPVDMNLETFYEYKDKNILEINNRVMRASFLRNIQGVQRFSKIEDEEKKKQVEQIYKNVMNTIISQGYTALCNGILYALAAGGESAEGVTIYTKNAFDKVKKAVGDKDNMLLAPGDTKFGVVEGNPGFAMVNLPERGSYLCTFTDKRNADEVRAQFAKTNNNNNIIAITFEELIPHALQCDGIVIDLPTYAQLIPKELVEDMKNQIEKQKAEQAQKKNS